METELKPTDACEYRELTHELSEEQRANAGTALATTLIEVDAIGKELFELSSKVKIAKKEAAVLQEKATNLAIKLNKGVVTEECLCYWHEDPTQPGIQVLLNPYSGEVLDQRDVAPTPCLDAKPEEDPEVPCDDGEDCNY